ncbi:hypothetical protein [Candidatus Palauibacter sp.]|uniref:hypothetical protein n=1 Tax=Candidatus Palauibacter sp. TaxID=3101350 RepID=UPI003B019726
MADLEKLETVLREVLSEQFSGVVFDSVRIREGTDHDDDAVLYVRAVFRSDKPLDVNARVGFVRHLRPHTNRVKPTCAAQLVPPTTPRDVHRSTGSVFHSPSSISPMCSRRCRTSGIGRTIIHLPISSGAK